jgi:peptidyl-tRNA hydrolase
MPSDASPRRPTDEDRGNTPHSLPRTGDSPLIDPYRRPSLPPQTLQLPTAPGPPGPGPRIIAICAASATISATVPTTPLATDDPVEILIRDDLARQSGKLAPHVRHHSPISIARFHSAAELTVLETYNRYLVNLPRVPTTTPIPLLRPPRLAPPTVRPLSHGLASDDPVEILIRDDLARQSGKLAPPVCHHSPISIPRLQGTTTTC